MIKEEVRAGTSIYNCFYYRMQCTHCWMLLYKWIASSGLQKWSEILFGEASTQEKVLLQFGRSQLIEASKTLGKIFISYIRLCLFSLHIIHIYTYLHTHAHAYTHNFPNKFLLPFWCSVKHKSYTRDSTVSVLCVIAETVVIKFMA